MAEEKDKEEVDEDEEGEVVEYDLADAAIEQDLEEKQEEETVVEAKGRRRGAPWESVFSSTFADMVTKKRNALADATMELMTIVRHFVRSPRYKFDVIAKKIAATATQQLQREAGKRARAMVQEEDEGEVEEVQVSDE